MEARPMVRYAVIDEKFPRELILVENTGLGVG